VPGVDRSEDRTSIYIADGLGTAVEVSVESCMNRATEALGVLEPSKQQRASEPAGAGLIRPRRGRRSPSAGIRLDELALSHRKSG